MSTVNVVVPPVLAAADVVPAATPAATASVTPNVVPITLSSHKYVPFYLTDKDLERLGQGSGVIPMGLDSAITSLASAIDQDLANAYKSIYGYAGTAAITPFSTDLSEYLAARKIAGDQRMPPTPRYLIINSAAEANALNLPNFQNASFSADPNVMGAGIIGNKLGALWLTSDNVPTHTAGTASGATTNNAGYALGIKTVTLASAGTGTILVGDVITFAGDTQTYVVTSGDADVSGGGTISFEPGLKKVIAASNTAITLKATHVANMLIQQEAIAFAMAPMSESNLMPGAHPMQAVIDPDSGLGFRITLEREFFRWRWAVDALWGYAVPRPESGVRLAG